MGPMKLYRLLQAHVGGLNSLVMALYKEDITAEDALAKATAMIEQTLAALKPANNPSPLTGEGGGEGG